MAIFTSKGFSNTSKVLLRSSILVGQLLYSPRGRRGGGEEEEEERATGDGGS